MQVLDGWCGRAAPYRSYRRLMTDPSGSCVSCAIVETRGRNGMKRYLDNTAIIGTLALFIGIGGSSPDAFAGAGACTVCLNCPGELTACFPGGTPVSATGRRAATMIWPVPCARLVTSVAPKLFTGRWYSSTPTRPGDPEPRRLSPSCRSGLRAILAADSNAGARFAVPLLIPAFHPLVSAQGSRRTPSRTLPVTTV